MDITWVCKPFASLTVEELYSLLRLRNEVFVVEQRILFNDADGKDPLALHLIGYPSPPNDQGLPCCYCRIFPPGVVYKGAAIGRVCSNAAYRRQGCGKLLMAKARAEIYSRFGDNQQIELGAQLYLKRFYEDLGYSHDGSPVYKDGDDIDHIHMHSV